MPAYAEGVVAAKTAQVAAKLVAALGVVDVSHVPLHVGLVHALVRAEGTGERRVPRIHSATDLHVPLQQVLQGVHLPAEDAHVSLGIAGRGLRRVLLRDLVIVVAHVVAHGPIIDF